MTTLKNTAIMAFSTQILQLGDKGNVDALQSLIKKTKTETIYAELEELIHSDKIKKFLQYIFDACICDDDWAAAKKGKVLIKCIKILQEQQQTIEPDRYKQIHNKIYVCLKGSMIKAEYLIKICNILIQSIEIFNKNDNSWQFLIPGVLNEISMCDSQEDQDDLMEAKEYNAKVIQKILDLNWTKDNIVSLAEMFLKVQLTVEENRKLIMKFMDCIKWLDTDTIPPLVYHLLKLASSSGSRLLLLLKLQQHYGGLIYDSKSYVGSECSESMRTDITDLEPSYNKLIESESNVFYHISNAVYCNSVQSYLEYLKNSSKLHEIILHPFNLKFLIIIATEHAMTDLLEMIKSAMIGYSIEEEMRERCFFHEIVSQRRDLSTIIKQVIDTSISNRDVVINGLVKLTFVLLTSGAQIGREDIIAKLSRIATFILIRIIECRSDMIKSIIIVLKEAMNIGRNSSLIMDCFAYIGIKFKFLVLQHIPLVKDIFDNFVFMSNYEANMFLEVMMTLGCHRPSIKEHVMSMNQKSSDANKLESHLKTVATYLKLLKCLKISSSSSLSQISTSSQVSMSTQLAMSRTLNSSVNTFSNEAICMEAIGDLQRVFRLQIEAQLYMYKNMPDVVQQNPQLNISIWEFLWQAFIELRNRTGELPPISFENISKIDSTGWVPTKSVSHLLMALALLLNDLPEDEIENYRTSFTDIASDIINCDIEHFILDQDVVLTDGSPEAQTQIYIIHEVINTYDAYIAYYILSWTEETDNPEQIIKNLFKAQKRLADYIRQYQKGKKKDMSVSRASVTSTTRVGGTGSKKLKLPDSIIPLNCLDKCIELLYSEHVPWTGFENGNTLKVLVSFHHYILESLISTIQATKQKNNCLLEKKKYWKQHFDSIEKCLYENCVKKQEQLIEFDRTTAVLTMEAFCHVLVIKQYIIDNSRETSSEYIFEPTDTAALTDVLKNYTQMYQTLFDSFDVSDDNDDGNRISLVIVNTIAFLASRIPLTEKQFARNLIDWMKNACREKSLASKVAANNFVACLINTSMRFTSSALVLRLVVSALGSSIGCISGEASAEGSEMAMINTISSAVVLQTVLSEVKNHHDDISWIMKRIKLEYDYYVLLKTDTSTADHQTVKRKERNICSKLIEIVTLLTNINNLADKRQVGSQTEKILQSTINIFKLLTSLANYFHSTSTDKELAFQSANFDGLVRHTMKKLVPAVYQQIQATEGSAQVQHIRSIPNVILGIETLKKAVMRLSIKTKVEVYDHLGIGVVRGFRVKGLGQHVEQQQEDSIMTDTEDESKMSTIVEASDTDDEESVKDIGNKRKKK